MISGSDSVTLRTDQIYLTLLDLLVEGLWWLEVGMLLICARCFWKCLGACIRYFELHVGGFEDSGGSSEVYYLFGEINTCR